MDHDLDSGISSYIASNLSTIFLNPELECLLGGSYSFRVYVTLLFECSSLLQHDKPDDTLDFRHLFNQLSSFLLWFTRGLQSFTHKVVIKYISGFVSKPEGTQAGQARNGSPADSEVNLTKRNKQSAKLMLEPYFWFSKHTLENQFTPAPSD